MLAVDAAVHAYNRTPHKTIEFRVPLEICTECKLSFQSHKEVWMHWFCKNTKARFQVWRKSKKGRVGGI